MWKNIWSVGSSPSKYAGSTRFLRSKVLGSRRFSLRGRGPSRETRIEKLRTGTARTMNVEPFNVRTAGRAARVVRAARVYASFVRFSHSVFALPFALAGMLLALREKGWDSFFPAGLFWMIVAMVAGRSAAMGFNRLVDARIDALNPRTAMRELPRGAMSTIEAIAFVVAASAVFIAAASQLNTVCFALSPVALAIVFWYSLAKR